MAAATQTCKATEEAALHKTDEIIDDIINNEQRYITTVERVSCRPNFPGALEELRETDECLTSIQSDYNGPSRKARELE